MSILLRVGKSGRHQYAGRDVFFRRMQKGAVGAFMMRSTHLFRNFKDGMIAVQYLKFADGPSLACSSLMSSP
jgi:hypothetical protein